MSSGYFGCTVCEMVYTFNGFWITISAQMLIMPSSILSRKLPPSLCKKFEVTQHVASYASTGTMTTRRTISWETKTTPTILAWRSFSRPVITDTPCLAIKMNLYIQTATRVLMNRGSTSALSTSSFCSMLSDLIPKDMVTRN